VSDAAELQQRQFEIAVDGLSKFERFEYQFVWDQSYQNPNPLVISKMAVEEGIPTGNGELHPWNPSRIDGGVCLRMQKALGLNKCQSKNTTGSGRCASCFDGTHVQLP
jgi:hypothetical protein